MFRTVDEETTCWEAGGTFETAENAAHDEQTTKRRNCRKDMIVSLNPTIEKAEWVAATADRPLFVVMEGVLLLEEGW